MKARLTTLLILGFAFSLTQTASADLIAPVGVIASGRMSDPENMIDESGMRVSGDRNDYRNWSSLPATKDPWHEANWFATSQSPGPWTILDLGSVCDLGAISIWSCNPDENVPYQHSATKLDVYVRKDRDRNNAHEHLAAFNPKGWTLLKSDLAVKPNPGGMVADTPSALLTGESLKGIQTRYVALHIKDVLGGKGDLTLCDSGGSPGVRNFDNGFCLRTRYRCHGAETQKADLSLHDMTRATRDSADALNWQDILDKLNAGEMPPADEPQPSKDALAKVVGDLTESLQAARKMLRDSGGAIALRRLNRREYQATIKELMGVRLHGEKLPDDPSGRFDTIGRDQSLSAMQLETYFSFAQEVARRALHWACTPRSETRVVRKNAANSMKREKECFDILEKVRIVHETDKPFAEVGLSEYEWNRDNRGTEKYPRHAEYRDRRTLGGYYEGNLDYHELGRMLPIRNLVSSIGVNFPHDARAHYRLRVQAGVLEGVEIRRVMHMTVAYESSGLNADNGKPIGSFLVTGTINKPSTHEMVWRPDFLPSFRPETNSPSRRNVTFLEDQRGCPGRAQLYQHYHPIEPAAPDETILVKWLEAEGPFYDPKTPFERLTDQHYVATASDAELNELAQPDASGEKFFMRDMIKRVVTSKPFREH